MTDTITELQWLPLLPEGGLVLSLVALLVTAILALESARRRGGIRGMLLLSLRLAAVAGIALVLLGPSSVERSPRSVRPPFVVMVDTSRSMSIEEGGVKRIDRVATWLRTAAPSAMALAESVDLRWFAADRAATDLPGASAGTLPDPQGSATDLGPALLGLRERLGGKRTEAVVLLSDGADRGALGRAFATSGVEGVRAALAGVGAPVSVVPIGDAKAHRDHRVDFHQPPPIGFVRRPLAFEIELRQSGFTDRDVRVRLALDGTEVAALDASFDAEGKARLSWDFRPDRTGPHTLSATIPVRDGDSVPANNRAECTVKVIRDRTRVLQLTSRPSWDVKFLRGLLKADPNIDLVSFFILRNDLRMGTLTRGAELSLIPFPAEDLFSTDLQGFDLVVLQNFSFANLPEMPSDLYLANVARYVRDGGGLLLVGGDSSLGAAGLAETPLADVFPAELPAGPPTLGSFPVSATGAGLKHPITSLSHVGTDTGARWAALPPLASRNLVGAPRPEATVLLEAGGSPVLVARHVGRGRSLLWATDSAWRWALRGEGAEGGGDHATFFRSAVRWLVRDLEDRQVVVLSPRDNVPLGERIEIQVQVLDEVYAPRPNTPLVLTMRTAGGGPVDSRAATTGADGLHTFQLDATVPGTLWIEATAPDLPEGARTGSARISVIDRDPELEDPRPSRPLLQAIAEATGGAVLEEADLRAAPRKKSPPPKGEDARITPLWPRPGYLLVILVALLSEWWLRRRWGLR